MNLRQIIKIEYLKKRLAGIFINKCVLFPTKLLLSFLPIYTGYFHKLMYTCSSRNNYCRFFYATP